MCVCENGVRVCTHLFEEHIHVMCEWVPMFYIVQEVHFTTEASTTVPSCGRYSRR